MKVSVIVPTYNNEATIAVALESIFAQRFQGGFEVIVVNDGSTDGTRAVLKEYGDRIRVVDQQNAGVAAARNTGIRAASGEYIALLDGDDTWTEDKLEENRAGARPKSGLRGSVLGRDYSGRGGHGPLAAPCSGRIRSLADAR